MAFNGFLHYRLRKEQSVTWRLLLSPSVADIALITAAVIIDGQFHLFIYVAYYPALALFAVVFPYLWLSLAWATMAGAIYAVVSPMVGPGLDFDAGQEKALLARVMAMYGVVASVSLIARFERVRRQEYTNAGRRWRCRGRPELPGPFRARSAPSGVRLWATGCSWERPLASSARPWPQV